MRFTLPDACPHRWYALQTKPKHEKMVATLLAGKGYEHFLPLYENWHRSSGRLKSVLLPLFTGYLFCRFDETKRLPILTTPGVFAVVSRGRTPEPIPDKEIEAIRTSCASPAALKPWPYLEQGELVLVEVGPLRGLQGVFIVEKSVGRLVLSISMLRRSVAVEVDRDSVRPIMERVRSEIYTTRPSAA